jgi:hypothetical protein
MRIAAIIGLVLLALPARAATPLCLEVQGEEPGVRKLVEDELLHHPSHHVVTEGCVSQLRVELFTVGGTRYLTVRINQEVPVRFAVKSAKDLEDKLSEAIGQVLQHDPVYLAEDISHLSAVLRASTNLVRRGINRYRLELFGLVGGGPHINFVSATGGAFTVARGFEHLQICASLRAAGSPASLDKDVVLRALAGLDLGFQYEVSARSATTFYLGPMLGLHFVRFEGPGEPPVDTLLLSVALRTGVRFLRYYGFDLDLFAQVHVPLYQTRDPDSKLLNDWTPYAIAGLGVGF